MHSPPRETRAARASIHCHTAVSFGTPPPPPPPPPAAADGAAPSPPLAGGAPQSPSAAERGGGTPSMWPNQRRSATSRCERGANERRLSPPPPPVTARADGRGHQNVPNSFVSSGTCAATVCQGGGVLFIQGPAARRDGNHFWRHTARATTRDGARRALAALRAARARVRAWLRSACHAVGWLSGWRAPAGSTITARRTESRGGGKGITSLCSGRRPGLRPVRRGRSHGGGVDHISAATLQRRAFVSARTMRRGAFARSASSPYTTSSFSEP